MKDSKLDRETFGTIVQKYSKAIFNAAFRIVNDYEDAMDITQTTFTRVYERLDRYDPSHDIFSWLYKITVNEAITLAKRKSRYVELGCDECTRLRNPEAQYLQNETSEQLQKALMALALDYRTVLILRHFHDLSYREIAEILGIPEKKVKWRLFTSRHMLRELLLKQGYTP